MGSPSGNKVIARQEDGLIFAPKEYIYLWAKEICVCQDFFLASSLYSHQLDIADHIMGSKRLGKTEDCETVKVPPAEAVGWGGSTLPVWSRGKCSVDEEHPTQRELCCSVHVH